MIKLRYNNFLDKKNQKDWSEIISMKINDRELEEIIKVWVNEEIFQEKAIYVKKSTFKLVNRIVAAD